MVHTLTAFGITCWTMKNFVLPQEATLEMCTAHLRVWMMQRADKTVLPGQVLEKMWCSVMGARARSQMRPSMAGLRDDRSRWSCYEAFVVFVCVAA